MKHETQGDIQVTIHRHPLTHATIGFILRYTKQSKPKQWQRRSSLIVQKGLLLNEIEVKTTLEQVYMLQKNNLVQERIWQEHGVSAVRKALQQVFFDQRPQIALLSSFDKELASKPYKKSMQNSIGSSTNLQG